MSSGSELLRAACDGSNKRASEFADLADLLTMTPDELLALPALAIGQADTMVYDDGAFRLWVSRCGGNDGADEDGEVSLEMFHTNSGRWVTLL